MVWVSVFIFVINDILGYILFNTPSGIRGCMNTKVIIDATRPATLDFEEPIKPPKEVWDRINLEEFLD